MKNYAFIFARGGSKGLPGKNIKMLHDKPLIQYAIDVALSCNAISKVFVSTDDESIISVASQDGVEVIRRPDELASDNAPEWLAWRHAIEYVEEKYGVFDTFVSLPATSPLRALVDVENALLKHKDSSADVCLGITPAARSPYFNMVKQDVSGKLSLADSSAGSFARRQDVPDVFDITTVVYVVKPSFVKAKDSLFEGTVVGVEVPKDRAVDIDDHIDFKLAKVILDDLRMNK